MTFENLPDFVDHYLDTSDFTIPHNADLSLIGEYTVTMKSEIIVPYDYTWQYYNKWPVKYDFKIYIEPCLVDNYVSTLNAGPITYRIGESTLTDGSYMFTEEPVCGYP